MITDHNDAFEPSHMLMTVLSPLSDTKDCIFDHYVFASTTESNTGQVHSIRWICAVWTMRMKKKNSGKQKLGGGQTEWENLLALRGLS